MAVLERMKDVLKNELLSEEQVPTDEIRNLRVSPVCSARCAQGREEKRGVKAGFLLLELSGAVVTTKRNLWERKAKFNASLRLFQIV